MLSPHIPQPTKTLLLLCQDDVPPRYHDISVRQSKARLDYDVGGSSARYADTYSERLVYILKCSFSLLIYIYIY